jgi:hypothetical protein
MNLKYLIPFIPIVGIIIIFASMFSDSLYNLVHVRHPKKVINKFIEVHSHEEFVLTNNYVFLPSALIQTLSLLYLVILFV